MSSGVEADIALDAAVVLSLGMNRVAGKAAGLTAAGAEALAALAQGRADARAEALAEAERQDRVVREVIDRHARIAVLADTQREQGVNVPLPAPLPPGDHDQDELTAWCTAADEVLKEAERQISEHRATQIAAQIFAVPAAGLRTELTSTRKADTGARRAGAGGPQANASGRQADSGAPRADAGAQRAVTLARVLARLAPDTNSGDQARVKEAAGLLADARTDGESEGLLTEVRLRVQQANHRTERRREEDRRGAAERDAAEQAEVERRYVLETVTTAFQEMGYEVGAGFETLTAQDGSVVLTRGNWPDHSVRMRVEDAGQLRAAMVRTRAPESEDDRRRDAEREREWCAAFEAARDRLAAAGIGSEVTWRVEPGDQELPVTSRARQTGAQVEPKARHRMRGADET